MSGDEELRAVLDEIHEDPDEELERAETEEHVPEGSEAGDGESRGMFSFLRRGHQDADEDELLEDYNVEANVGFLGLGGTGNRVASHVYHPDLMPLGVGEGFGFDLDADERPPTGPNYQYVTLKDTGGIPAGGIYLFSQTVGHALLRRGKATAPDVTKFRDRVHRATRTGEWNLMMPIFGAGGGVGHGLFRSIVDNYPVRKNLFVPLMVYPSERQNLSIRLSATAAVGRFQAAPQDGDPRLQVVVENDVLQAHRRFRRTRRNQPIVEALRMMGASIDTAFAAGTAEGNVDRAILSLMQRDGVTLSTLGTASVWATGRGERCVTKALERALRHGLLAREPGLDGGGMNRLIIFATVPKRWDVHAIEEALDASQWNLGMEHEIVGKFVGPTETSTVDVCAWVTGNFVPQYMFRDLRSTEPKRMDKEVEDRLTIAGSKLDQLRGEADIEIPDGLVSSMEEDIHQGLGHLRRWA